MTLASSKSLGVPDKKPSSHGNLAGWFNEKSSPPVYFHGNVGNFRLTFLPSTYSSAPFQFSFLLPRDLYVLPSFYKHGAEETNYVPTYIRALFL